LLILWFCAIDLAGYQSVVSAGVIQLLSCRIVVKHNDDILQELNVVC